MVVERRIFKKKGIAALLSRPTGKITLQKTIAVPSNGVLGEGILVGGLSFAIHMYEYWTVVFLNVLEASLGLGKHQS